MFWVVPQSPPIVAGERFDPDDAHVPPDELVPVGGADAGVGVGFSGAGGAGGAGGVVGTGVAA